MASPEHPDPATSLPGDLIQGCREGRTASFQKLYEMNAERMKSVAYNLLRSTHDAEDATQETFMRIYRNAGEFKGASAFSTWIFRILINVCYDMMRRRQRRRPEIQQDFGDSGSHEHPAPFLSDHPLRLTIEKSIRRLDLRRRTVFLLFEVEGFKHREIARILNIPEGTSKNLLFEAKKELQRTLARNRL